MSEQTQTLVFKGQVKAPRGQVFRAFTNATALREWFCDAAMVQPRLNGRFLCGWDSGFYACGHFTTFQAPEGFTLSWFGRGEPAPSTIEVSLEEKNGLTSVTIQHHGIGSSPDWVKTIPEIKDGWEQSLENLSSVLETGQDLRFIRRPMLGITITDFSPEIASRMGVPVSQGVRLDSVIVGMGAEAAGLQAQDVIVAIDGKEIVDFSSMATALQKRRAGDTVEMVFYRGAEKKIIPMTLSGRPIPPMPATVAELAVLARKRIEQACQILEDFVAGISDEEAGIRPQEGEWSVKEVIAHLIHGERGYQNYVSEVVSGFQAYYDDYGDNLNARVEATVAAYPSLQDLMLEFKRAGEETAALLERLPSSFAENKGSFWRIAYGETEGPYHLQVHLEQMKAAVQIVRQMGK